VGEGFGRDHSLHAGPLRKGVQVYEGSYHAWRGGYAGTEAKESASAILKGATVVG
jgi:hypothetical protein